MPAFPSWAFTRCHHHSNCDSRHPVAAHYSFIDPERMKGWVALVGWPVADGLPTSGDPSATGQAQHSESTPAKDRCSTAGPCNQHNSQVLCEILLNMFLTVMLVAAASTKVRGHWRHAERGCGSSASSVCCWLKLGFVCAMCLWKWTSLKLCCSAKLQIFWCFSLLLVWTTVVHCILKSYWRGWWWWHLVNDWRIVLYFLWCILFQYILLLLL